MEPIIVLAMHGSPPNDFPKDELSEFFSLHARFEHVPEENRPSLASRYADLDAKIRAWPRNAKNDPFFGGAKEMALHLQKATGYEVIVGYNEFCAPSLDEAVEQAVVSQAEKIIVITPMMTRGKSILRWRFLRLSNTPKNDIPILISSMPGLSRFQR